MRHQDIIMTEAISCFRNMSLHELNSKAAQYVKEHYAPKRLP